MTAKVLQLVNSSFFGLSVHVQDVTHAAALLGLNALRPLVLSAGVFRQLEESKVPTALVEEVLNHSLAVGQLGKQIAEAEGLDRESADNAMLAGILHDVGSSFLRIIWHRPSHRVLLRNTRDFLCSRWTRRVPTLLDGDGGGFIEVLWACSVGA